MSRPTFIDLRTQSAQSDHTETAQPSPQPFLSPRMQHFAGDVPPSMSPLDIFAMQSRLLARQLDESSKDGRRVSRLPPLTTTDPISQRRGMYQSRSAGQSPPDTATLPPTQKEEAPSGNIPDIEQPAFRPKSFYPRLSHIPPVEHDEDVQPTLPVASAPSGQKSSLMQSYLSERSPHDYFMVPRSASPEPTIPASDRERVKPNNRFGPSKRHQDLRQPHHGPEPHRGMSVESKSSKASSSSLHPPMSPPSMKQPSIRSIPVDSSDDENSASTTGSGFSGNRKLSSSSNVSTPYSPNAPFAQAMHGRSPSLNSEYSIGGTQLPRPAFNFSRPLSRGSRPSMDMPRQPSFDSRTSLDQPRPPFSALARSNSADSNGFILVEDSLVHPVDTDAQDSDGPAPSYIYNKFALPTGRVLQKNNSVARTSDLPQLEWGRPSDVRPSTPLANKPLSPGIVRHSPQSSRDLRKASPRTSLEVPRPSFDPHGRASPRPSTDSRPRAHPPLEQPKISFSDVPRLEPPATPVVNDDASAHTTSTRSDATIKPNPRQIKAMSGELSAEDHLAKGIALHEKGENRESTYHLRIAAKANLPTGMLLYALACRHGWGMRPNQAEAVQWLRKAADSAALENNADKENPTGNFEDRKQRTAQLALSIYELGQSHFHGWGIEQDRTLALKCYLIAAEWGDADAMTEAGFCYTKGVGCKKDLKKAAKYYRMAEAKGMSMVGNSWIYKPKYADDSTEKRSNSSDRRGRDKGGKSDGTPEKKGRDKSRTRTIFGRRKSISKH